MYGSLRPRYGKSSRRTEPFAARSGRSRAVLRHVGTTTTVIWLLLAPIQAFGVPADPDDLEDTTEETAEETAPEKTPSPDKSKAGLELLRKRILYASSTERRNAIRDLKRLSKDDQSGFYDDLVLIVKTDRDPAVREAALRFLAEQEVSTAAAKEAYIAGLDDPERNVKLEALKGIRRIRLKEAGERLARLVSESELTENDSVIHAAIRTLGSLEYESPEFTKRLLDALDSPETEMESRRSIILYAGAIKAVSMEKTLLDIANDPDADLVMRAYAANALGKTAAEDGGRASAESRERYKKAMHDVLDEIRSIRDSRQRARMNTLKQQAILALIRMGDDSVKEELRSAAQDDDANTRFRAIRYIGELKLKEYRDLVEYKAKYDQSPKVRKEAERVLKEL